MPGIRTLLLALLLIFAFQSFTQCLTALPPPDCNGSEPLITDGETIASSTTKWYYGATVTMNTLTLDGGTLVVCGDLTIDKFYMTTGTIFVRQGARFVIGSGIGAGLQFKGNCAIYNYGTCEIQRNLTLENNASAANPNIVINALSNSVFKMSNQYFVISNAFSWFVNNGTAEFWGIITDNQSSPGSVCLGSGSSTKMAVMINKVANTYVTAPASNACLHVYQYSEFYGQLTSSPTLFACLGSGHTSNSSCIPFGCSPNNWGAAQVFTNCAGCAAFSALSIVFSSVTAEVIGSNDIEVKWQIGNEIDAGKFKVLRSADGIHFSVFDSIVVNTTYLYSFKTIDHYPLPGNNYYMIQYTNPMTGLTVSSKMVKTFSGMMAGFNLYPVPFENKFYINYEPGTTPIKILLTDVTGRDIRTRHIVREVSQSIEVIVLDNIQPGLYIVHMQTDKTVVAKTIFKR